MVKPKAAAVLSYPTAVVTSCRHAAEGFKDLGNFRIQRFRDLGGLRVYGFRG